MSESEWIQWVISFGLQSSLVIGVASLLDKASPDSPDKGRAWTLCFLGLYGLVAYGFLFPRLQLCDPWTVLDAREISNAIQMQALAGRWLFAIWGLGAAYFLLKMFIQFVRIRIYLRSCPLLSSIDIWRLFQLVPESENSVGSRAIVFRQSSGEVGPFCYQFHQPTICLPRSLLDSSDGVVRQVLTHEITHLRARHPAQVFVQRVLQSLLWFYPLVRISASRARLVREFACDDAAVSDRSEMADYLRTLLKIANRHSPGHHSFLAIGRSSSELKIRALRITSIGRSGQPSRRCLPAIALLFTIIVASQLWIPSNPSVTSERSWSRCPTWTATVLHAFGLSLRDFELTRDDADQREQSEQDDDDAQSPPR